MKILMIKRFIKSFNMKIDHLKFPRIFFFLIFEQSKNCFIYQNIEFIKSFPEINL